MKRMLKFVLGVAIIVLSYIALCRFPPVNWVLFKSCATGIVLWGGAIGLYALGIYLKGRWVIWLLKIVLWIVAAILLGFAVWRTDIGPPI